MRKPDPRIRPFPIWRSAGWATQLIVDGKPFLILGAEPPTSAPSNLEYLKYMFSVMTDTGHQNTAAIAVGWNWIEPEQRQVRFQDRGCDD